MSDNLTDRGDSQASVGSFAPCGTIRQLLEDGARQLLASRPTRATRAAQARGTELAVARRMAALEATLLLERAVGETREAFIAWPERRAPPAAVTAYRALLERACRGEPLAYLVGQREFWSLALVVNCAVLIPRAETELAVERCLARARESGSYRVCDLGTGSGAIALALAKEHPEWQLTATDVSAAALEVARHNAERLALPQIQFLRGDWFNALADSRFDLIVSNPPYVGADDAALASLSYEPRPALTPGPTGMEALGKLVAGAPAHLVVGGWLVLEHGADQAPEVARALQAAGYACIACHRDLAGRDRVTEAQWPGGGDRIPKHR